MTQDNQDPDREREVLEDLDRERRILAAARQDALARELGLDKNPEALYQAMRQERYQAERAAARRLARAVLGGKVSLTWDQTGKAIDAEIANQSRDADLADGQRIPDPKRLSPFDPPRNEFDFARHAQKIQEQFIHRANQAMRDAMRAQNTERTAIEEAGEIAKAAWERERERGLDRDEKRVGVPFLPEGDDQKGEKFATSRKFHASVGGWRGGKGAERSETAPLGPPPPGLPSPLVLAVAVALWGIAIAAVIWATALLDMALR